MSNFIVTIQPLDRFPVTNLIVHIQSIRCAGDKLQSLACICDKLQSFACHSESSMQRQLPYFGSYLLQSFACFLQIFVCSHIITGKIWQ